MNLSINFDIEKFMDRKKYPGSTEFYRYQLEVLMTAIFDERLEKRHVRVLTEICDRVLPFSELATVSREELSALTGYTSAGVAKTVSELIRCGYLVSKRWAVEPGQAARAHYRVKLPTHAIGAE